MTCNSGVDTDALDVGGVTSKLSQITDQDFIPFVVGVMTILLGAAAPTALVISYETTLGTPIDSYTVEPGLLVMNAELIIPLSFFGPSSKSLYSGAGATPMITVNATAQAVTVKAVGSRALFQLVLGN